MKLFQTLLAATTLTLLFGCDETTSPTPSDTSSAETATTEAESNTTDPESADSESATQDASASGDKTTTLEDVKKEVSEASEATREFTAGEMKDYKEKLNAKLADFDKQLDQWKVTGKDLAGDAKKEWQEQLKAISEKRSKLRDELDRLGDASGDAWQDVSAGIDDAWTDLKAAADKAAKDFDQS